MTEAQLSEVESLRRYASFIARFAAAPMAVVRIEGSEPVVFTYNRGARARVNEQSVLLDALCSMVAEKNRLISIANVRQAECPAFDESLAALGVSMLAFPVTRDEASVGCVAVIDDVARGWFSDDVAAIMDIATSVGEHVDMRARLERAEASLRALDGNSTAGTRQH